MKNIYLIFIVSCFVEQLKADVYAVRVNAFVGFPGAVATTWSGGSTKNVTIYNDIKQREIWGEMVFMDSEDDSYESMELRDLCNMDTSTKNGTIAAILWGVLGVESCPVAAGTYSIIHEFNKTGIIEGMFVLGNETMNIISNFMSSNNKAYFQVDVNVRLVEKNEGEGS